MVLDHHLRAGVSPTWDNQRKAFCAERRIANNSPEEIGDPLLAEAFRQLASQWCYAADYVAEFRTTLAQRVDLR